MPKKPETYYDLYPGRFIHAGQFNGRDVTLTIKDVDLQELEDDDGKKNKAILSFEETKMQHVACKTNGICLREMFGTSLKDWVGKRVTFFPSEWNGEPAVRVKGSPDIDNEFDVVVKLARRKPRTFRMHKTKAPSAERKAS